MKSFFFFLIWFDLVELVLHHIFANQDLAAPALLDINKMNKKLSKDIFDLNEWMMDGSSEAGDSGPTQHSRPWRVKHSVFVAQTTYLAEKAG